MEFIRRVWVRHPVEGRPVLLGPRVKSKAEEISLSVLWPGWVQPLIDSPWKVACKEEGWLPEGKIAMLEEGVMHARLTTTPNAERANMLGVMCPAFSKFFFHSLSHWLLPQLFSVNVNFSPFYQWGLWFPEKWHDLSEVVARNGVFLF